MRYIIFAVALVMLAAGALLITPSAEEKKPYIGVQRCAVCHQGEEKGSVYEKWAASPHAAAFESLATPGALEIYRKVTGKDGNPQEDGACLKCHVTGYGADTSLTAALRMGDGVTCESCHQPGAVHVEDEGIRDRCTDCHNEESPTYKPFDFKEAWKRIAHPLPPSE